MSTPNRQIAINYGVMYGIVSVVLVLVQYAMGDFTVNTQDQSWAMTGLSIALGILFPVLAMVKIKKSQGGYISFGEGFKSGFTVYIISAIFVAAWMLIYTLVLEPGYQEALLDQTYSQMIESNPNMTDDQIEMGIGWTEKFTSPWILALWTIVGTALMGAIVSLILAAIVQKKQPESI